MIEGRELLVKESDTEMDALESRRAEKLGREVQVKMISVFRKKSYGGSLCRKLNDVRKRRK